MYIHQYCLIFLFFFFFNNTPPPHLYPLSLHDALPILASAALSRDRALPENRVCSRRIARSAERARWGAPDPPQRGAVRSEEHTSELQSRFDLVCRLLLEKKKKKDKSIFLAVISFVLAF